VLAVDFMSPADQLILGVAHAIAGEDPPEWLKSWLLPTVADIRNEQYRDQRFFRFGLRAGATKHDTDSPILSLD
jgi:hypothetical protein